MPKSLTEMAADIVAAQATHTNMSLDEIRNALIQAYNALASIRSMEEGAEEQGDQEVSLDEAPASDKLVKLRANPMRSIKQNSVTCLECGQEFKVITKKHLGSHGLTPKEYRKKYGIKAKQALSSKALSAARKATAERLGLADKLAEARAKRFKK